MSLRLAKDFVEVPRLKLEHLCNITFYKVARLLSSSVFTAVTKLSLYERHNFEDRRTVWWILRASYLTRLPGDS